MDFKRKEYENKERIKKYRNFLKNKTKGWIGEELFAELLRMKEYKVIKFGIENNFYILKDLIKKDVSNTALQLRHMPDYVIIKNNNVWMVEVKTTKYKNEVWIDEEEYESLTRYWPETILVVISYNDSPYIRYEHVYNLERMFRDKRDNRIKKKYYKQHGGNKVVISFNALRPLTALYNELSLSEIKTAVELLEELNEIFDK
ncbi:MAG: NERD domain-containing protein [Candidatus Nanohaloarchaeota archaeon]|nr:NERD domain-containing protein [Candidatus Nanohaloarchaeota archaeon]